MNTPNYPPPGGPQRPQGGPYGQPGPYGAPGGRPPQTPPGGQPYGAPGGQPGYGQPGPGGPYGQPSGPGGPAPYGSGDSFGAPPGGLPPGPAVPPPAPSRGPGKAIRAVGILVAVLIVGGAIYFLNKDSASSAQAGDCIKVNDSSATNPDIEKTDCNSADAQYKVGVTKDNLSESCPTADYLEYTETGKGDDVKLCMVLIAKAGDCFKTDGQVEVKVACDKGAEFKVLKVIEGSTDKQQCGGENAANAVSFPEPKITFCLTLPDGA